MRSISEAIFYIALFKNHLDKMWWIYNDRFESGRFCCDCFEYLPFESYKILRHGWKGRHSRCRECDNANARLLYQLKKYYPYPRNGKCEYCFEVPSLSGGGKKPLHLDHCHDTNDFRGWACQPCNLMRRRPWGKRNYPN